MSNNLEELLEEEAKNGMGLILLYEGEDDNNSLS